MNDKELMLDVISSLNNITSSTLANLTKKKSQSAIAKLYEINSRFNFTRVFEKEDVKKIWDIIRNDNESLVTLERIITQWRLSSFENDDALKRVNALIATSVVHANAAGSLTDDAYREPVPDHAVIETLYTGNLWLTVLFLMQMCPDILALFSELSKG
tara:strand:- start:47615 stop:48088 length:474 start_codon:yes stop_codon:yes gene_type:complete